MKMTYEKVLLSQMTLGIWIFSAWITHIVVCLKAGSWGFLIAGAIAFPIAWVHGTGVWFNFW